MGHPVYALADPPGIACEIMLMKSLDWNTFLNEPYWS